MDDILKIDSAPAAAVFAHSKARRILLDLVANERSLQDLAHATGLSLSLLHYHLARLLDFGLVRVVREDIRPGRPVKRYRAVAHRYFVPAALATHGADDALARELRAGLERDRARRDDAGIAYFVDDAGRPRMSRVPGAIRARAFEAWITLSLNPQDAEDLSDEIRALFARYSHRGDGGARRVIAYCAFAERR